MDAREYAQKAGDIFVLPDVTVRIKELIDDDSASMLDIAELINYDPGLTVQLLKIANSALYRFPSEIQTLERAVQVIGTKSVYDLVTAYSVAKAFKDIDMEVIDLDRFWERSVCCALLAKYLADALSMPESERLFVAGLLHNVGELVMVQANPDLAKRCTEITAQDTPLKLQIKHLGFTYADVGAELISLWGIPSTIYAPIQHQNFGISSAANKDQKVIQLATILSLENIYPELYQQNSSLAPELFEPLGFNMDDIQTSLDFTNLHAMSVIQLFSPSAFAIY